jgi:hypothetical protein
MKHWHLFRGFAAALAIIAWITPAVAEDKRSSAITLNPTSMTFNAVAYGSAPPSQSLQVTARSRTRFTAGANSSGWLSISPSGALTTDQTLTVSVNPRSLAAGTYKGSISITSSGRTYTVAVTLVVAGSGGSTLTISPSSLSFSGTVGGSNPASQSLSVTASTTTSFTASASVAGGSTNWLSISPSGSLTTNRTLAVSANLAGLNAGTYNGTISIVSGGVTRTVGVTLLVTAATSGGTGYKILGWNDLGMHCFDGADYSVFGVLPPYNTIHAHLIDSSGKLINATTQSGYKITYQAIPDPLTNSMNTTSIGKTNFWTFAAALGFGNLSPDVGLTGFKMPGSSNIPQNMTFSTADNTWEATGIPITPFADSSSGNYARNYFPMMRLTATDSSGRVLATQDIVLPTSDEMTCSKCHSSTSGYAPAMPAAGWVNASNPAQDVKLNILRKHDDAFKNNATFKSTAGAAGYNPAGLEATVGTPGSVGSKPIFCDNCHASNALSKPGYAGVPALTVSMHGLHSRVIDPATGQTMSSGTTRDSCYSCHPGPNTQCYRGVMAGLTTSTGAKEVECQNCHGPMTNLASTTRQGWLDVPNCQSCHVGTATSNGGTVIYASAYSSGGTLRTTTDMTFATNPNTPSTGLSMFRFSSGHGGLQCEACHGSTHAIFGTSQPNDNVMSTNLQGHTGTVAECTACHASMPSTTTGGPHGLHPIGTSWVSGHQHAAQGNQASCQPCHGTDYRGTILSKTLADRTLAGRSFPKGTIIGCYSCHNGPNVN